MIRTQIQLEEPTWERVREIAFQKKSSIAAVIREMIRAQVFPKTKPKLRMGDFSFIGSGKSNGKGAGTIAGRHDEEFTGGIV
jgi:hypothetical protein